MSADYSYPRGLYFDEIQVGQKIITAGRTITEADIVNFAGVAGDFTQIHVNAEYCKNTPFGKRVAHGLLVVSIISGLGAQTGVMEGTVLAFREIKEWKFAKPVFIGDSVHAELEVVGTRHMPRIGGGAVDFLVRVKNQGGDIVMRGTWTLLFAERPR